MKIAIIGAGIAGIYAAHELDVQHDVDVYEASGYPGGHTDTHHINLEGQQYAVDSGFIVYNQQNYPGFCDFLEELGITGRDTDMSLSVSNSATGLEYNPADLNRLFCQRRNLLNPHFYGMLRDLLRFYREAPALLKSDDDTLMLGDYLQQKGYGQYFVENHLLPMASALWSGPTESIRAFPVRYFVQFLQNHQMLNLRSRPVWRTLKRGSQQYVDVWLAQFRGRFFRHMSVESLVIEQNDSQPVKLKAAGEWYAYDRVFVACHADQALAMLDRPSQAEQRVLGGMPFQKNHMQLHSDTRLLPRNRSAWASWNARVSQAESGKCTVSYNMNILQGLNAPVEFIVSLNSADQVDPSLVYAEREYSHPVYTPDSLSAQKNWPAINGKHGLYYCGAYWGWGFHEDGVQSAKRAVALFRQHNREATDAS